MTILNLIPTRRKFMQLSGAALASSVLYTPAIAQAKQLTIISNRGSSEQRKALEKIAKDFGDQSGATVTVNNLDHEANKTAIRNYLVASPPDICFWFSGARMRSFVDKGLFEDISDLVEREKLKDVLQNTIGSVTVKDRQYGLPTAGILWGLFYRQDTFDQYGLTPPKTFDDFFTLAEQSKKAGIIPMGMGTKEQWPVGGWFDHMNLRINGLQHHMDLMAGKIKYTDGSLKEVFDLWEKLLKADFFTPNGTSYAWDPIAASLAQKKTAMMDLGNFIKYGFPQEDVGQLRFMPFPQIKPGMDQYEDFSLDSIHIPSGSKNKDLAKEFLAYFYKPEQLTAYLKPEGNLPARSDIAIGPDHVLQMAADELKKVKGTSQYYDRDTDPDMAQAGLNGFQEFTVRPERRDGILQQIERTRARIYG